MTTAAADAYRRMSAGELRRVLLVEYRCARGCLLLHVWQSPAGPMYYRPPLRVSQKMHDRTGMTDLGRVPETAGALADLSAEQFVWGDDANAVLLGCPHCIGVRFPAATVKTDAAAATPGAPFKDHTFWMTPNPPTRAP